jgi:hypothetical protein
MAMGQCRLMQVVTKDLFAAKTRRRPCGGYDTRMNVWVQQSKIHNGHVCGEVCDELGAWQWPPCSNGLNAVGWWVCTRHPVVWRTSGKCAMQTMIPLLALLYYSSCHIRYLVVLWTTEKCWIGEVICGLVMELIECCESRIVSSNER